MNGTESGPTLGTFRELADHAASPLAVLDLEGRFLYANLAFAHLISAQTVPDDLMDVEWFTLLTDEIASRFRAGRLQDVVRQGWEGEVRQRRRGGAFVELHVKMFPIGGQQDLSGFGVAVDVAASARPLDRAREESLARDHETAPILPIAHRVILVPLVGVLDATRSRNLMRSVLVGIATHRAKAVILDGTGLGQLDPLAADRLSKTVLAARLKGARTVVTGLSQETSEILTDIGVEWRGIQTVGDLATGLIAALGYAGLALQSSPRQSSHGL